MRSFVFILVFIASHAAGSEEQHLNPQEWSGNTADEDVVFMTRGPNKESTNDSSDTFKSDTSSGKFYRVYYLVYEAYYSLIIEEMAYSGVEGSETESVNKTFITGFEISSKFPGMLNLTYLRFEKWISWNSFIIKENETELRIHIKPNDKFSVEKVP